MQILISATILAILIEALTLLFRIVFHYKSVEVQKKIHWPRVHHSYVGALLIVFSFLFKGFGLDYLIVVIGSALIASDVIHHLIFLPLLSKFNYDIGMINHHLAHIYVRNSTIVLFLLSGIVYSVIFLG